jgi:hypothetical protein
VRALYHPEFGDLDDQATGPVVGGRDSISSGGHVGMMRRLKIWFSIVAVYRTVPRNDQQVIDPGWRKHRRNRKLVLLE